MMRSRLLCFIFLCLSSLLVVTACHSTTSVGSGTGKAPLRVSYGVWPGYFPIIIAKEKGFFQQQGVKVEAVFAADSLSQIANFNNGQYDGTLIVLGSVMNIVENNPDVQIPLVVNQSAGGDAVVVSSQIDSIADLKGKRIGTRLGDFGKLFVTQMLKQQGLTPDDVKLINLEGENVPKFLQNGKIDAGHTWEPYLSQAVEAGSKVMFSSKQTPGLILDVLLFQSDVVRDRPKDIKAFIKAWFQAQDYWQAHPQEGNELIAKTLNLKPEQVALDGIELSNLAANRKFFLTRTPTQSLYHTAKLYVDFYTNTGILSTAPDLDKLIDPLFIQQLQSET